MQTTVDNLSYAQALCDEIKQETVCSNDIIPRSQLPYLTLEMIPSAEQQFGSERIDRYTQYTTFVTQIRNLLTEESTKRKMPCGISSRALAVASFGVGECQELSTLALNKLVTRGRHDVAFIAIQGRKNTLKEGIPFLHTFVLLGLDSQFSLNNGSIKQLNSLPNHIIVIDPLLSHVGHASRYLDEQSDYLTVFDYDKICVVDVVSPLHVENISTIQDNIQKLRAFAESQGRLPFDRAFLDLPLANNPSAKKPPCEETTLLRALNERSGLTFTGRVDERCRVDAVTEIHSAEEVLKAQSIQYRLRSGCFYAGETQRFFVIHDINVTKTPKDNLPKRIHEAYFR